MNNNITENLLNIGNLNPFEIVINLYWIQVNKKGEAKIEELEWKNIADIWSGFSNFLEKIIPLTWWKWKYFCIDPIFENKEKTKQSLIKTFMVFKERIEDVKSLLNWKNSLWEEKLKEVIKIYSEKRLKQKLLNNWIPSKNIIYKTKLEKSDKVDIAFCSNVFYDIPYPVDFIEDILTKINDNWELIIIDYKDPTVENIRLLLQVWSLWIIDMIEWEAFFVFKIKKENFLNKIDEIRKLNEKFLNSKLSFKLEKLEVERLEKLFLELINQLSDLLWKVELSREDLINNNFWKINPLFLMKILEFKEEMLKQDYSVYYIEMTPYYLKFGGK